MLVVRYDFEPLTACHFLILRCLMHVKLNVIKLFNRLSLTANQNGLDDTDSSDVKANNIRNSLIEVIKTADASPTASPRNNQKFIIPSNYPLHEDDLSRIDVKSLVRNFFIN